MNDAASQFAKSSANLIYIFNPLANPKKEEQVSVIFQSNLKVLESIEI